jgi:ATP-dependent DNA helicase RecG
MFVESEKIELKREVTKDVLKEIIAIEVNRGDSSPYYIREKGMKPSGVYKRLGNTSIPISEADIRKMIIENHGVSYESTRSFEQELTFDYLKQEFTIRELILNDLSMKSLDFFDDDGLYTNLALLLSDQCPHLIKAAIFEGDDKMKFRNRQEFSGSVLKQMNEAYRFVELQNGMTTTYDGLRRIDEYEYDNTSLREALVNAIVHRDYGLGGDVFLNLYRNYIEFLSIGGLPTGFVIEDVMAGVSKLRNERLARVFYKLELIEAYGTGIFKIQNAYKEFSKKPEFHITPNAFILRLPKRLLTTNEAIDNIIREVKTPYQTDATKDEINLLDKEIVQEDILNYMVRHGQITRKKIQELYGFSQTKSGSLLRFLEESKLIVKKGHGKNVYYIRNC